MSMNYRAKHISLVGATAIVAVLLILASSLGWQSVAQAQGTTGICGRSLPVQDAILDSLPDVDTCADVTDTHLSGITGRLDLIFFGGNNQSGTAYDSVEPGDFAGLSSLTDLTLSSYGDSTLPEDLFDGLGSLKHLELFNSQVSTLPEGIFEDLDSLQALGLRSNPNLATLPAGLFDGLTSLEVLNLGEAKLTGLPAGLFGGLSSLEVLELDANQLSSLPEGIFGGLSSLELLSLETNQLESLPAGVFRDRSSLEILDLDANQLSSLPDGAFEGLSSLLKLNAAENQLEALPDGAFAGLTSLTDVSFTNNPGDLNITFQHEVVEVDDTTATLVVNAAKGVPVDITVTLSSANPIFSLATFTIPAGSTQSQTVTATRPEGVKDVSVEISEANWAQSVVDTPGVSMSGFGIEILSNTGVRWNDLPTGAPTISGTAQVGIALTVDTSGITDVDVDNMEEVTFSYQWLSGETEIEGATDSTYTVQYSDEGNAITVRVTFPNTLNNLVIQESLTSEPTAAVVLGGL